MLNTGSDHLYALQVQTALINPLNVAPVPGNNTNNTEMYFQDQELLDR